MRVLVLGATGMLGHTLVAGLAGRTELKVHGTVRGAHQEGPGSDGVIIHAGLDARDPTRLATVLEAVRPDAVVNAIGVVKQRDTDAAELIELDALFPHRLARLTADHGARLIHVSTDCVFSGRLGGYSEADEPDPIDRYGHAKLLGEVVEGDVLTIRTSIIGHELATRHGLVDWFLAQPGPVAGYRQAIFSGLPTVELARLMADHILPRPDLRGLLHVSAAAIAKLDLLRLVAEQYRISTKIEPRDEPVIDRSLDGARFATATGYHAPLWPDLVAAMHTDAVRRYGDRFSPEGSAPARAGPPSS